MTLPLVELGVAEAEVALAEMDALQRPFRRVTGLTLGHYPSQRLKAL